MVVEQVAETGTELGVDEVRVIIVGCYLIIGYSYSLIWFSQYGYG
jgi:hypothetical protein